MPVIPPMALVSSTVDAEEIYREGLFKPVNPPTSLEILNGGMDELNYGGGAGTLPTHSFQYGAFVAGFYVGFDRWEFTYARQMSDDNELRVVHAGLSARIFIPFAARYVLYGFQAWFRQDATVWDTDGLDDAGVATTIKHEFWDWRVMFGGSEITGLGGRLPPGRYSPDSPTTSPFTSDPGAHAENRWRYVARTASANNVAKGYETLRVSVWSGVIGPDPKKAKLVTPSGGLWILAMR
jgi:hypothetical protein